MTELFKDLMQRFVNEDYDTLLSFAKTSLGKVLPAFEVVDEENKGMFMVTSIILSAIGADGSLTAIERRFLKDLLGIDDEAVSKMITMYDSSMAELTDSFEDNMPSEIKTDTLMLVTAIAACDEKISSEESAFIRKLMA